jgi:hypothetical protein
MAGKLGKLAPKPHPKTLLLSKYLRGGVLPPPSPLRAWEYVKPPISWGMFGNDSIGDCTCAAKAHILMCVSANTGTLIVPTVDEVVAMYSAISGYDPVTGNNDNGCAMTDVMDYLLKNGLHGRKILGWVQIDQANRTHFEQCVELFGACDVGFSVPQSAVDQFDSGQPWDIVDPDGGIVGGHDVPYLGYGRQGETCITWAKRQPTGIPFFAKYVDEGYGIIWEDWFDVNKFAPNHFNQDQLWADLQALKV